MSMVLGPHFTCLLKNEEQMIPRLETNESEYKYWSYYVCVCNPGVLSAIPIILTINIFLLSKQFNHQKF